MPIELRPEPESEERAAIEAALRRLVVDGRAAVHPAYSSRWRRAGLELDAAVYATARRRRRPGAERA